MNRLEFTEVVIMNKTKIVVICFMILAGGYAIVSYEHFYRGRIELGGLFAILSFLQIIIAVLQLRRKT